MAITSPVRAAGTRKIIHRADLDRFRAVATFLLKVCCGGRPEVCGPLIADLVSPQLPANRTNRRHCHV